MNDHHHLEDERKSPSALVSALAASSSSDGSSSSAFRELVGSSSSPSMRTAALARMAAASAGGGEVPFSTEHQLQQLLLAQQRSNELGTDGGLHLGLSPQVATLLAHQRLKQLHEQAAASGVGGLVGGVASHHPASSSASSSVDASMGLAHLSTLGMLQHQPTELLLAEQIRQHHGRLLASQLALHPSVENSALAPLGNGLPRSSSTASSSSAAAAGAPRGAVEKSLGAPDTAVSSSGDPAKGGPSSAPRDEADDDGPDNDDDNNDRSNSSTHKEMDDSLDTFPFKLFRMLEEAEAGGGKDIVSFNDKGRCFLIHKPKEFVAEIMPKYFTTTRMSSFQRQLNLYGFRRIPEGPDKGGYVHESFIRGQKSLCRKIKRKKPNTKVTPSGLMYVNPSSLSGGMMENNPSSALSVRQVLADGQRSSDQLSAAQQLAQLGNLGGLVGMYGVGNSTLSTALMLEQQQLRLRLLQQQQQADLMQQLLLRHQHERDLAQLLQRHQQDPPPQAPGSLDSHNVAGAQQPGPR